MLTAFVLEAVQAPGGISTVSSLLRPLMEAKVGTFMSNVNTSDKMILEYNGDFHGMIPDRLNLVCSWM
jgi:hypothetical protein